MTKTGLSFDLFFITFSSAFSLEIFWLYLMLHLLLLVYNLSPIEVLSVL